MKIGIVTVVDSANFGSFLQGLALQDVLQKMGHEVEFISTRDEKYIKRIYYTWKPRKRDLIHPFQFVQRNLNGYKKRKRFLEDQKMVKICPFEDKDKFDLCILGSDEIWNVRTQVFRLPVFYGTDMKNVITYAVSSGQADKIDFRKYPEITERISEIQDILVRDKKTQSIVKEITGEEPDLVCDPTFLADRNLFFKEASEPFMKEEKYLLVYMYPTMAAKEDIKSIKIFASSRNLKLVSVGFYNAWCDHNIVCGPMEFCSVLQNAQYVITATFHGSIFSILNEKQFITVAMSDKVKDLLKRIGLEQQLVPRREITEDVLKEYFEKRTVDYDTVNTKINEWKKYSLQKLSEVIKKHADRNL